MSATAMPVDSLVHQSGSRPSTRETRCHRLSYCLASVCCCIALTLSTTGCGLTPPVDPPGGGPGALAREIEEADIIKLQDGHLYIANPYTGLRIVDARAIDAPVMKGSVPLGGRAVELFVRDNLVFVFTAADFLFCAGEPTPFSADDFDAQLLPDYKGSRLWVVDIADSAAPVVTQTFDLDGFMSDTRRVGDVIYVAGTAIGEENENAARCADTCRFATDGICDDGGVGASFSLCERGTDCTDCGARFSVETSGAEVFVTSINIADPEAIVQVDTESFRGSGLNIHVSERAIYVFGDDPTMDEVTSVTYVDVSDPDGDIAVRDQFRVPGEVDDRYHVDEYLGTLRIVTEERIANPWSRVVALYTYDTTDPDDITRLARLPIISDESLRAVRFDGERGYVVTFVVYDPLFVLDLSDPTDPRVTGELEVPGYSTHLVPLGDRLIGVGFDTEAGTRPAVALYDVFDPAKPRLLDRVIFGDRWIGNTGSSATVDEKALRVVEEAGLVLMPYSTFDHETGTFTDAVQLLGLNEASLSERGTIEHRGVVRRADLLDDRLWVLSDEAFQTVNIDDLDAPASLAVLKIISEQELLDAGLWNCARAAREQATDLTPFWGPVDSCGFVGMVPLLAMFAGLGLMKLAQVPRIPR